MMHDVRHQGTSLPVDDMAGPDPTTFHSLVGTRKSSMGLSFLNIKVDPLLRNFDPAGFIRPAVTFGRDDRILNDMANRCVRARCCAEGVTCRSRIWRIATPAYRKESRRHPQNVLSWGT